MMEEKNMQKDNIMVKSATERRKFLSELIAIVLGLIVAFTPPPSGLTPKAMWTLALLAWAVINWVLKIMPDFCVILIMCCAWVLLRIVPFTTAFGVFATPTIWLLVGVFGIGIGVTKSGLLKRVALKILKLFPPTFNGQILAMMITGLIIGPAIPSSMAKIAIASPMASSIGETMGFKANSHGMLGLFAATYTGYSLLAPAFISASFFGYMILSLMPENVQQQFSWLFWFEAMIPWCVSVFIGCYFAIKMIYNPGKDASMPKDIIEKQIESLGPMTKNEKITLVVLVICIVFWILESFIKIPAVIPAIMGCVLLIVFNIIDFQDYNTKIAWHIITFAGGVIAIAGVLKAMSLIDWFSTNFGAYMGGFVSNPYIFVILGSIVMFLLRFIIVDHMTAFTLFIIILSPFCLNAGISPWIAGIIAYVNIMPFVTFYQNIQFVVAYQAFGGEAVIEYKRTISFYFVYMIINICALLVSVPYWKLLGLIK